MCIAIIIRSILLYYSTDDKEHETTAKKMIPPSSASSSSVSCMNLINQFIHTHKQFGPFYWKMYIIHTLGKCGCAAATTLFRSVLNTCGKFSIRVWGVCGGKLFVSLLQYTFSSLMNCPYTKWYFITWNSNTEQCVKPSNLFYKISPLWFSLHRLVTVGLFIQVHSVASIIEKLGNDFKYAFARIAYVYPWQGVALRERDQKPVLLVII